ncbi:MAG TPA: hypothetical protein EYQ18_07910 [Candidatus Handelsmanbacteria bacterium]|nr:hypothetical protein [Candidatus Handelsmanbacteria bacterium]
MQTIGSRNFQHAAFRWRLQTTLSGSMTDNNTTRVWRGKLGATYRLSDAQALILQVQSIPPPCEY